MKKRLLASCGLLLFIASPTLHSQSSSLTPSSTDDQQSPSVNCTNELSAYADGCDQTQYEPSARREPSSPTGIRPDALSTSSMSEGTSLRGRESLLPRRPALAPNLPTEFQKFVAESTGQMLQIYGVNLFNEVPSTFSPNELAPVTSEYVIGPEDELRVRIWGQITYSGNLRVDRSGNIYLPQAGTVHVAGLQFAALDQHLREAIGRMYRNFDLSVDIGQIRSMQIYVTGQARRPGVYTVSSLSSLVDALFASGGPSPEGSLRHILLNRDGKTIADFDLYGLLMRGDKSKDIRLLPEDVLYIPVAGPQVAIAGSVRSPGIFEMRTGETIGNLIEAAGKATAMSSNLRISLDRAGPAQLRQAMELKLDSAGLGTEIADGDILRVYPILPAYGKTVTLRGNVANPGRFGWHEGMRLSDLIPDRDSLVGRDYWWKRSHLGLPVPEFEPAISTIGLDPRIAESNSKGFTSSVSQETLTTALNASNRPQDDTSDVSPSRTLSSGSIASGIKPSSQQAGAGAQQPNDVTVLTPEIDWEYAVIERIDPETLKTSLVSFDLGKLVLNHDAGQDLALEPGDTITIFSKSDIRVPLESQTKYVHLEGEIAHAGIYSVLPGETLQDVVRRAGGFTPNAYLYGASFTRESTRMLQQQRIDEYARTISMDAERGTQALAIAGSSSASGAGDVAASRLASQELTTRLSQVRATGRIVLRFQPESATISDLPAISLENGDRFIVPYAPATINVVGAVYDQNSFLFRQGRTVEQYLRMAGGPNRNADWRHAFVIRADGSVVSRTAEKGMSMWTDPFIKLRLNPGDTIVVPDKTLRPTALRGFLDWSQLFSQLALGAAAIHAF
jgi:protein involved in polysaccharide export with SLBB domain